VNLPILQQMVPVKRMIWPYLTSVVWKQFVPNPSPNPPMGMHIVDIVRFFPDETVSFRPDTETIEGVGTYTVKAFIKNQVRLDYTPVVPYRQARRIFNVSAPEEFRAQLGNPDWEACTFLRSFHKRTNEGTRSDSVLCAWKYEDIALVIYAQSYLMHVLTGPDRRRYEGVPEGVMARTIENAKETQEPTPCFKLAPAPELDGMYRVELLGEGHVPFVSNGTSLRFFNPSLALRAARVLQQDYGDVAAMLRRTYDNGSNVFATLLAKENKELLAKELAAVRIPLERFETYEFMGTRVVPPLPQVCAF